MWSVPWSGSNIKCQWTSWGFFFLVIINLTWRFWLYLSRIFLGLLQYTNYLNPTFVRLGLGLHFWFDWIDNGMLPGMLRSNKGFGEFEATHCFAFVYHNVCHLLLDETRLKEEWHGLLIHKGETFSASFLLMFTSNTIDSHVFSCCLVFFVFFLVRYYHYVFNQLVNFVPVFFFVRFFHWTWIKNCTLWRDSPGYNALLSACDRAAETRQAMPGSSDSPCFFGWRWGKSGNVSQ